MKTKTPPFVGFWHVVAQETRIAGKWQRKYDFKPGEWTIGFFPNGKYGEIFRPADERIFCDWTFDADLGIISIHFDPPGEIGKCVFKTTGKGVYLYFYDDLPNIPLARRAIIAHHAHKRHRLVRILI